MKFKFFIILLVFLVCFSSRGLSNPNSVTEDMFGLRMEVVTPYPDTLRDAVDMDTVRYGCDISISIFYKNQSNMAQKDFKITAFFPNRIESYTRLEWCNQDPDYIDPDSSREASWQLGTLAPLDSGRIDFRLRVTQAPRDTIYLSYGAAAQARWTPVSQVSHTNIYVPSGPGISEYPNLWIDKADDADWVFPGDTITYKIRYGNNGAPGSIPAQNVAIIDTLPTDFEYIDGTLPAFMELNSETTDGRTLLIWELQKSLPRAQSDSLSFLVRVGLITDRDSLIVNRGRITSSTNELIFIDNYDGEPVWVRPKINLAIKQEGPNQYNLVRDGTQGFNLTCKNLSSLALDDIKVQVEIDDGIPGANIYSVPNAGISNGGVSYDDTLIAWVIPNIPSQDSTTRTFSIVIDNVEKSENYSINFTAEIDSTVKLPTKVYSDIDTSDNHDAWVVKVDATPDLSIKIEPDGNLARTGDTRNFKLTCKNSSIGTLDSIGVRVYIDDSLDGMNIYTFSSDNGRTNQDTTSIEWKIRPLSLNDSQELSFSLIFDKIKVYNDYPDLKIIATIDSLGTDSLELQDNKDSCKVFVDGTPELSIELREKHNRTSTDPDSSLNFILTCKNLSSTAFDSINVRAWIDDNIPGANIYTVTQTDGGKVHGDTLIEWKIPPLSFEESKELSFSITFDRISESQNYTIEITAAIDSLEINPQEFANNKDSRDVSVNAAPEILFGQIAINPEDPGLRTTVEYTIPYSNSGNFLAKNAVMTIERPDYTYLLYYIQDGSKHVIEDSTTTTYQISLGDLPPDIQETILVGLKIYSYKELPGNVSSPIPLKFSASITFDGGKINTFREDQVYFNPTVADLILDKNIVEPGSLPLGIIFISSDFGDVEIKVYNLAGEFIKTIHRGAVEKGDTYRYQWDGLNEKGNPVASGVYFIYAVSKFYNGYKKVIIVK